MPGIPHLSSREISWMYFNARVLQEAEDPSVPLIERIKFLGIFSNNLDEFFRVRVATLNRMARMKGKKELLDFNPRKLIKTIMELDTQYQIKFQSVLQAILKELEKEKIFLLDEKNLSPKQGAFVKEYFQNTVRPNLFPIMLSNTPSSFHLKDQAIYLGIAMRKGNDLLKEKFAVVQIPTSHIPRFLILPGAKGNKYIIFLDDVIRYCLDKIFPMFDYDSIQAFTFKFTRDAELDLDTDISKSFLEVISESLKKRVSGVPLRFLFDREMPDSLLKAITRKLDVVSRATLFASGRYHNFKDFRSFPNFGLKQLEYPPLPPLPHPVFSESKTLFHTIRNKDLMLHTPYQSFHPLNDLLGEASIDPNVRSIRMTLYRLATNSIVVNSLINAARNGKSVTVFMELQARFDEEANLQYTERLQEEGVHIIRGIPGFKVHAKLLLIRRKENNQNAYYSAISTGNFNEQTAQVYADNLLFTADQRITSEVLKVFDLFESNYKQQKFRHLVVSPFHMRDYFMALLKKEMKNAKEGREAWAIIKLNNLVDEKITRQIILAAQAGVNIKLIIRGTSILNTDQVKAIPNLEIFGVIDRFLEHSRVFVFANGGEGRYFISSADWMVRNFDNRIEVCVPIYDPDIQKELLTVLNIQLKDNTKARLYTINPPNQYRKTTSRRKTFSQLEIYKLFQKGTLPI